MDEYSTNALQSVGAALIVGAIAGAVWFAVNTPSDRPAATAVAEAPRAAVPGDADIAKLMHVEPAPVEVLPPLAAEDVRVCGQAVSRAALADERIERTLYEAGAADALEQFARQHLADDDHARAVGLVLRMQADANYRAAPDSQPACKTDDCWKQQARAHAERVAPLLTELAELAGSSTDPRVMMLARGECANQSVDGLQPAHCQLLTARRLVALDRDNGVAWLALAVEEPGSIDEAMYQSSLASRWDDYAMASRRFIDRIDAKGGLRSMVITQALLAVPALRSIEGRQLLIQHCSDPKVMTDANRRQLCEKTADGLHARSTTVAGQVTAGILAKALDSAHAKAWQEQALLLNHVLMAQSLDDDEQTRGAAECAVGMSRELLMRSARDGEVPALRAWMLASGKSDEQWRAHMMAFEQAQVPGQAATTTATPASAPK